MRLSDLHSLAGLLFPLLGEQLVVSREQLSSNIVGGVEQSLIRRLDVPDGQTGTHHQGATPTAGSFEQGTVSGHTSSRQLLLSLIRPKRITKLVLYNNISIRPFYLAHKTIRHKSIMLSWCPTQRS